MPAPRSPWPLFEHWRQQLTGPPVGPWNYSAIVGGWTLAATFATVFWPELIEVDGCILLSENHDPDRHQEWMRHFDGDREQVERMINHVHLWDLFNSAPDDIPTDRQNELARIISKTWAAASTDQFPDHTIKVQLANEPDEYGPTLTLYVDRA